MNGDSAVKYIVPVACSVIIALIAALWVTITAELADLKTQIRVLEVEVTDMRVGVQELKDRYSKLADIFNGAGVKKK